MKDRYSTLKGIALGAGLALVVSAGIVAAQVSTGPVKSARMDPGAVCCAITAIDAKAGTITAKVTKTGQTFTLTEIPAAALGKLKVGANLDVACAVPPNSGTGVVGSAASGTGSAPCGSNVPRNADTRPKDCVATNSAGVEIKIACPQNVPIRAAK